MKNKKNKNSLFLNFAKKSLKILLYSISAIIGVVIIYLLCAFLLSIIPVNEKMQADRDIEIFIRTNGVHTDIVLPVKYDIIDWSKKIRYADTKGNDSLMNYISFGWGDKGFYLDTPTWAELKFSTAFNAAFALGHAAMHVTYYKSIFLSADAKMIKISKDELYQLNSYIEKSFVKDDKGEFINIKTDMVYGANDAFYDAVGKYSLFRTCNTWTNTALKICGQRACLWTPFDKGIFYQYRNK
ncbi:MAG: TIGR02117 family protein [Bacteroidetes bacterium]|nr:TIGR02117 family protein [Bacteroidota bacterium]